jgi:hypothetical protein
MSAFLPSLILAGLAIQNFSLGWPVLGWTAAGVSAIGLAASILAWLGSLPARSGGERLSPAPDALHGKPGCN